MTRRGLAFLLCFGVFVVVGCQAPLASVAPAPTAEAAAVAPVTASQAIWGEVPKQCA